MQPDTGAAEIEQATAELDILRGQLDPYEQPWAACQQFLESRGYLLRPRYRPGWTPSWRVTGRDIFDSEDAIVMPPREHLLDAIRIPDSTLVYIKRVKTGDNESRIATMLSADKDPRNHAVPILDLFEDEQDPTISYMVMPFLHLFDYPEFETVEQVVGLIDQLLEGLVFLHEKGVAHRDCTSKNLMMDAEVLYPKGHHPVHSTRLPNGEGSAPRLARGDWPIRYYYVDFGISSYLPPHAPSRLVVGMDGRDQEVPELSSSRPYDPFKVDIFIVGNVFRHELRDKYSNMEFLAPLIEAMIQRDPSARPTAAGAYTLWCDIRCKLGFLQRRWRVRPREELSLPMFIFEVWTLISTCTFILKSPFRWFRQTSSTS